VSAAALPVAPPRRAGAGPAPVVRLVAFGALALFAGLRWATLLAPAAYGRMALATGLALAVAAVFARGGRFAVVLRIAAVLVALVLALPISGVPARLLAPAHWGDLTSGLSQGIQTLPGIGVPYRGVDPWVRIVMLAGGVALLVLAGALATRALRRDRRPLGAALMWCLMQVRLKFPGSSDPVPLPIDWNWRQFVIAAAFAIAAAVFAGLLPARKGARVQPVDILRGAQ